MNVQIEMKTYCQVLTRGINLICIVYLPWLNNFYEYIKT